MAKRKVIRDSEGNIINIGDWDLKTEWVPVLDEETNSPIFEQRPDGTFRQKMVQIDTNPLPEGAKIGTADIVTGADGGLYEKGKQP